MPVFQLTVGMIDDYNRKTTKRFESVATMADFPAALAAAATLITDLGNIGEARILWYEVGQRTIYTDSVTVGANIDEGVTFTIEKEDNNNAPLHLPAPINAIFDGDGNVILTDTAVTAFISHFLTGGNWTFNDGEQGNRLVRGKLDK